VLARLRKLAGRLARGFFLLVVFVLTAYFTFNYWVRRGVTRVPDVVGLSEEQARQTMTEQGLAFRRADFARFSDQIAEGNVYETKPAPGSYVKRGAEVEVVLSRGANRVAVPDLVGKSLAAARLMLDGEGLAVGPTLEIFSARGAAGTVVGQDPPPAVEAGAGSTVALLVARDGAPPAWVMPDLVARRYDAVRSSLEADGFRFGNVAIEPYEGAVAGTILRQTPAPGHPLRRSDAISLVVAGERTGSTP